MVEYKIDPLRVQNQGITFPDWISILTLCFAPLIAHVLSGAPRLSYLSPTRPTWHDQLTHYNPTSILWRYAAITDRRIRARIWDPHTTAASNAVFWTASGWDGSERMVFFTRPLAARLPEHSRVALFSTDMLWTIIVTAQGASAMYSLIGGLTDKAYFNSTMGLDTVFFPLAVFGLLRLFPAFWLTDDFHFAYENRNSIELTSFRPTQDGPRATGEDRKETYSLPQFANSRDSLDHTQDTVAELSQFRQTSFWPSRIFRVCYMLPLLCLFVFTFLFITPFRGKFSATLTAFLVGLFFFVFFAISIVIFLYYFARGYTTTTTIPCIASTWYKVYTFLLFFLMGTMMVIAALETRKTPCGRYTSLSGTYGDLKACWDGKNMALPIRPDMHGVFALASNNPMRPDDEETIENTWLYDFTGTCLGMVSANSGVNQGSNYSAMYDGEEWAYFIASLQALEFSQQ